MALPFDPSKGELKDTIPVNLDYSKMLPMEKWKPDCTHVVLLACGSYSPPTIMHTRIFETARDFLHINQSERKIQIVGGFMSPVHELYGKKSLCDSAFTPHRVELVMPDHSCPPPPWRPYQADSDPICVEFFLTHSKSQKNLIRRAS